MKINISGSSLWGFFAPEVSQIVYLQELILHNNSLIGIIPKELGTLKNLEVLELGVNQLTGPIPPELGNLTSIVKLNLQSNRLAGNLPAELGNLRNLDELLLDRNRLIGSVPASSNAEFPSNVHGMLASSANSTGFCRSSQLKIVDFSYIFFIGRIPRCLKYLTTTSFQGNCLQNQEPKQRPSAQCGRAPRRNNQHQGLNAKHQPASDSTKHQLASKPTWLFSLEIVTGVMVGSLFLIALVTAFHR